ncbi:hemolysin family protein [Novispirillum itersonii]|uniref:hemolysin family protein n=1 Tax=Novispirillum itersonii TaxID=189 RepID=UPI0005C143BD|nr:hemolysin family protein [Novispirillum itersonii]
MSMAFEIAVIAFLVLLNGWFALSEMAIVSARKARLIPRINEGSKGAEIALRLSENPGKFLSSVQIGITLVGILAGTYSGATLTDPLADWLNGYPLFAPVSAPLAMVISVGAITYASLIIGELVPKRLALSNPERLAILVAPPMALIARLASPLVWLLEASTHGVLRLLGAHDQREDEVTEEEIKALVAAGTENGVLKPEEQELISGVIRFGDRKIKAIMTPRSDVELIDLTWDRERMLRTMRNSLHSRLPVCEGGPDNFVGVIQSRDLLNAYLDGQDFDIAASLRSVPVVHDNSPALVVLDMIKQSPIHMAIVADEYGGMEGIVTASDILSSIVGALSEHGEDYGVDPVQREDGSWLLDGDTPVDLAAERTGCAAIALDTRTYSTIAGFVLARAAKIPETGDVFVWDGWRFEVVDMDGRRIDKLMVSKAE